MNIWFLLTISCLLALSLVVMAGLLYLYATHRRRYILIWAGSWGSMAAMFLCMVQGGPNSPERLLVVAFLIFSMSSALLMLWGARAFAGKQLHPAIPALILVVTAWIVVSVPSMQAPMQMLPVFVCGCLAYMLAGRDLITFQGASSPGNRIAGWILVLMGLHQLDHPLLPLLDWIKFAGVVADAVLLAAASLAVVIAHFERARWELDLSESRFRQLAESSPDIIWTTDAHRKLDYVSPAVQAMLGHRPEEVLALPRELFLTPESLAAMDKVLAERDAMEADPDLRGFMPPLRMDVEHCHQDGHTVWTEVIASRMRDDKGRLTGIIGLTRDIHQRRELEKQQARQARADAALLELTNMLVNPVESVSGLARHLLDAARDYTDSDRGFVTERNGSGKEASILAMDPLPPSAHGKVDTVPIKSPVDSPGLFQFAMSTKDAFFTNDPQSHPASRGVPQGHAPINNFLTAPAMVDGELLGHIAVANAPRPYTDDDLRCVTRMANVYALAMQRKRIENDIRASLVEKETLLQEIHHRVKNNLQIISGLLYLQADLVSDPASLEMFQESQQRIASMALVHEELYRARDLAMVNMAEYATVLSQRLLTTLAPGRDISCSVTIRPFSLAVDKAVPLGLVLNELLTNAVKHAFPGLRGGGITIDGGQENGHIHLRVADDGVGLPPDMDPATVQTLGLQLVTNLTEQLHGTLSVDNEQGAGFTLEFDA